MDSTRRLRKVINWLIYQEVAANERELADMLGYKKSSFSQLVNGKVPLSDKFVAKLCSLDTNINKVWVLNEEGQMFLSNGSTEEQLRASLSTRDRQVDELIDMLKGELAYHKRGSALLDAPVECADVG